ncbi:leucine rich repeat containing 66 isoform X2 [Brachyhypopomus gauderio]|uniref:leucine rich repeat containing 66 isoform X2 n=1 Tax=Brachyhypopomus gauderio TaxID=698409 RepID=UPI0040424DF1
MQHKTFVSSVTSGLSSAKSLQVLQLSHNMISKLGPADIAGLSHLRELYLQHNLINIIHPQAFKDLQRLQVLDLSYNLLTIIPVPAYLSLRNMNALVDVTGNKWRCDCNLKTLRRWLKFDGELGHSTWEVVCFSPTHHSGKDLRYLKESEVVCSSHVYNTPGHYKEETVDEGMELLLSCDAASQDIMEYHWWTPHGHVSESQQILLSNITEQHAGLYVCVSGFLKEHVSVLNLNVRKIYRERRPRRDVKSELIKMDEHSGRENTNMLNNIQKAGAQVAHSEFVLAVCLSVFITFIVAFVLGVLLRPLLDKLYRRIRTKRDSTSPPRSRSSSIGPQSHINEGYCDNDDQMQKVRVGSRVRFGGVTEVKHEAANVPYYVTVEDAKSTSSSDSTIDMDISYDSPLKKESFIKDVGAHCIEVDNLMGRADHNPSSLQAPSKQSPLRQKNKKTTLIVEPIKVKELEPIPDPVDATGLKKKSVSSTSSYERKESIEQSVDSPTVTLHYNEKAKPEKEAIIPGCSGRLTEPREENVDKMDPDLWNDSGESFSFSDSSPRSSSRISQLDVLECTLNKKEMSVDKQSDRQSSSSSSESDGGQTEYIVNPEEEESEAHYTLPLVNDNINLGENRHESHQEGTLMEQPHEDIGSRFRQDTITLDPSDVHVAFTRGDSLDDELFTDQNECSDTNSDSEEPKEYNVHPVYRMNQTATSLSTDRSNAGSSSEDEGEYYDYPRRLEITDLEVSSDHSIPVALTDRVLNINFDNSSSSTDIEEKTNKEGERKNFKGLSMTALLLNRSRAETDEANQPLSKTTNTDNGRFLGSSFDRQRVSFEDNVKPTTDGESQRTDLSLSSQESIFGNTCVTLDPIPKVKRYLQFSQSQPHSETHSPSSPSEKGHFNPKADVKIESRKSSSSSDHSVNMLPNEHLGESNLGASFDELPKVMHHLHFSVSESHFLNNSPSLPSNNQVIISDVVTTESKKTRPSSEDNVNTSTNKGFFFDTCLDAIPKVKRYLQFIQSEPQTTAQSLSTSVNTERITPDSLQSDSVSAEELSSTNKGDGSFRQIETSLEEVPKVERYIQFTQLEPEFSVQAPSTLLNTESITPQLVMKSQSWSSGSSSEEELSPANTGDGFFEQIGASREVPNVKRYIQFSQSEHHSQNQSQSPSSAEQVLIPEVIRKTEYTRSNSSSDDAESRTNDEFFKGTCLSFDSTDSTPKVKRSLQFTQIEPQPSNKLLSPSLHTEKVIVDASKTEPISSGSSFHRDAKPNTQGNFFECTGTSLVAVGKVKRYIQFTQSGPQAIPQCPSTLLNTEGTTPELVTKPQSWRSHSSVTTKLSPTNKGDGSFRQIDTSLEELPKVKRYIQFTNSEPELSVQGTTTSLNTERKMPALMIKPQTLRSDSSSAEELSPTTKENSFYGQIGTSVEVPKVNRYIQFTQSPLHSPSQSQSQSSVKQVLTPQIMAQTESKSSGYSSDNYAESSSNFFEAVCKTLDSTPKVKRSLHFSQPELQSSIQSLPPYLNTEIATTDELMKTEGTDSSSSCDKDVITSNQGNFIGQIGSFHDHVPKVQRYLQFSQSVLYPTSHPSSINIQEVPITEFQPRFSRSLEDIKQASSENNFFERMGSMDTSDIKIQKLKKVVKFTHHQVSTQPPLRKERITPELESKPVSTKFERNADDLFRTTDASLEKVPKLNRHIHFDQSVPYTQTMSPSSSSKMSAKMNEGTDSRKSGQNFKMTETISPKEDSSPDVKVVTSTLGQLSRPKRSLFFSNSDSYIEFDQPFTQTQPGLKQTGSYFSADDKEKSNAQDSKGKTRLSTRESETTMESRWSSLVVQGGLSSTQSNVTESPGLSLHSLQRPKRSLQVSTSQEISDSISISGPVYNPRRHVVADIPIQVISEEIPETPQASSGNDDAKEFLRHSSEARQWQERRRLMFQQKRRAMDSFGLISPSSTSDDDDKQGSMSVHYEKTVPSYTEQTYPGVSTDTRNPTPSQKNVAILGFEVQSAKSLSSLRCKSALHDDDKYHSNV